MHVQHDKVMKIEREFIFFFLWGGGGTVASLVELMGMGIHTYGWFVWAWDMGAWVHEDRG